MRYDAFRCELAHRAWEMVSFSSAVWPKDLSSGVYACSDMLHLRQGCGANLALQWWQFLVASQLAALKRRQYMKLTQHISRRGRQGFLAHLQWWFVGLGAAPARGTLQTLELLTLRPNISSTMGACPGHSYTKSDVSSAEQPLAAENSWRRARDVKASAKRTPLSICRSPAALRTVDETYHGKLCQTI